MSSSLSAMLAATIQDARRQRGLSGARLAELSGVSRAMISKIERGEAEPTAALLGRLSAALGLTLSQLIAHAEREDQRLARAADQPVWTDPVSGYQRRAVSPAAGGSLELVEVQLPAGAEVAFAAGTYAFIHQQIWVLDGHLTFLEGSTRHELDQGDCLQLSAPQDCAFLNPTDTPCRYLVALARR
jgi:transcriptional regulator with XRE-family HTH domain